MGLMREIRRDPTTGDEVLIASDRLGRPRHLEPGRRLDDDPSVCPFCPGHEAHTPPTLASVDRGGRWIARAFPNKYPALRIEGELQRKARGPYERITGIGAHEVIVETPEHGAPIWRHPSHASDALRLARDRMRDLSRDGRFRQLAWFRNVGPEAGASLGHPHAQILAMPEVPPIQRRMAKRFRRHWERTGRELMQDLLDHDLEDRARFVWESSRIAAICAWAPKVPFEVWLVPTAPAASFLDADDGLVAALAEAMCRVLGAHARVLDDPPYNATLYTAPQGKPEGFRWHMRLMPRLSALAGFELGCGATMHASSPEQAAELLREAL
jgi:UDPglucose--hexose-1-phosphate uridylyltransferase